MDSRQKVLWTIIGGVTGFFVLLSFAYLFRQDSNRNLSAFSSPAVSRSPGRSHSPEEHQDTGLSQSLAGLAKQSAPEEKAVSLAPPPDGVPPALDESTQRKIQAAVNANLRARTRALYGQAFQKLGLSSDLQNKVIDILIQPEMQLQQQAMEAAQAGTIPVSPSPEALRAQQVQQDQQLHSALGDAGFTQFSQYRATIPDRIIIDAMNRQGANLSETQSQQLLQVLTEERQQIIGQAPISRNLDSMPPDQAMAVIQQQQTLLQQAVGNRIQNILTPEQSTMLQGAFSQFSLSPKAR